MRTQKHFSRELSFGAHMTGPNPLAASATDRFFLHVTGQDFVDLKSYVPFFFPWSNLGQQMETGVPASFGEVDQVDGRDLWGSSFVARLHDNAEGQEGDILGLKIRITGRSMLGRKLEETFWIRNVTRTGAYLADAYYGSRFAYAWFRVTVEEFEGTPTTDDYLRIGFDVEDHYDPSWWTHARERNLRYGLPFPANDIQDIQCVKIDRTPMGTGSGGLYFPKNVRGFYPIDLQQDGALFDREDNAIIVNSCTELTRSVDYGADDESPELETSSSLGNHLLLFSVDPENPDVDLASQIVAEYTNFPTVKRA